MTNKFARGAILTAALLGFSLFGSPAQVQARDRDDKCEKRIHKAEVKLHEAERRHGEHSRQAEERRHQLEEVRENCHRDGRTNKQF